MGEMVDVEGLNMGRLNINNISYADDTVLIADTEDKLHDKLDVECNRVGLKINIGKAKVMGVTKRNEQLEVKVAIGNQKIKQVRSFRYLGSFANESGKYYAEVRSRMAM